MNEKKTPLTHAHNTYKQTKKKIKKKKRRKKNKEHKGKSFSSKEKTTTEILTSIASRLHVFLSQCKIFL